METTDRYTEWLEGLKCLIYQQKKMTQVVLAKKAEITQQHINAILKGRRNAGQDSQELISRTLGMSYDQVRNLGRKARGLPPIRVFAELGAPHQSVDDESTSVDQTGMNCRTVVNGGGSVNGVNNGTIAGIVQAAPVVPPPSGSGEIAQSLCEMITEYLADKTTDEKIEFRARVKRLIVGQE